MPDPRLKPVSSNLLWQSRMCRSFDVRVSNVDAAGDRCPAAAQPSDDMWAASPATRNHDTSMPNATQFPPLKKILLFNLFFDFEK